MVAKATTEATLQGALTPSGDVANTAAILQTGALTDGSYSYPGSNTTPADGMTATAVTGAGGNVAAGNYQYYVTFVNGSGARARPHLAARLTLTKVTYTDNCRRQRLRAGAGDGGGRHSVRGRGVAAGNSCSFRRSGHPSGESRPYWRRRRWRQRALQGGLRGGLATMALPRGL